MVNIILMNERDIEELLQGETLYMLKGCSRDRDRDRDSDRNRDSDRSKCNTEIIGSVDDLYNESIVAE